MNDFSTFLSFHPFTYNRNLFLSDIVPNIIDGSLWIRMKANTHTKIDTTYSGSIISLEEGKSTLEMTPTRKMAVDEYGLIHGGFLFSLADHAAMVTVNHPNVVLGSANVKFLKPVSFGDALVCQGKLIRDDGNKKIVTVTILRDNEEVFSGEFTCFVLEKHVLEDSS